MCVSICCTSTYTCAACCSDSASIELSIVYKSCVCVCESVCDDESVMSVGMMLHSDLYT